MKSLCPQLLRTALGIKMEMGIHGWITVYVHVFKIGTISFSSRLEPTVYILYFSIKVTIKKSFILGLRSPGANTALPVAKKRTLSIGNFQGSLFATMTLLVLHGARRKKIEYHFLPC